MNLEDVTVELRPRSAWEAADLGARMIRRDAGTIYKLWFALTLPAYVLAALAIAFTPVGGWATLALWWIEPIFDGPILHVISRRLFGAQSGVRDTLREVPRMTLRNWVFLLTPLRLHLARSIAIPLTQLEGLSGSARRKRARVLNHKTHNYGVGLTVAYHHLVLSLFYGVGLIAFALIPTAYQETVALTWLDELEAAASFGSSVIGLTLLYIAQSALHPWFVGCGFGLYVNRRTQLEAWDVEVAFRRMVQRRTGAAIAVSCLAVATLSLAGIQRSDAQELEPAIEQAAAENTDFAGHWNDATVRPAVEAVFETDALRTSMDTTRWQRKTGTDESDDENPAGGGNFGELMSVVGRFLAVIVEFGLWIGVALLVLLIYLKRSFWLPLLRSRAPDRKNRQRVILADGEITAADLPTDIPAEVLSLWRKNRHRDALCLLFRGSIFNAVTEHDVALPKSATETECVAAVARSADDRHHNYFEAVVDAWSRCAYGSIRPEDRTVEQLCAQWSVIYGSSQ